MVCNIPELSLDLSPPVVNYSTPKFLKEFPVSHFGRDFDELSKLDEFICGLEEELKKIHAFQRELPLSFSLLNDAVVKLKEKANKCDERRPSNGKFSENVGVNFGIDVCDKRNWMSSAQLWGPRSEGEEGRKKSKGEAISSFQVDDKVPGLSLSPPPAVEPECKKARTSGESPGSAIQAAKPVVKPLYQVGRKQRRSWSPELHHRFVDALEKLGGPQVATPKQIRELMQVDGLTNDEVKSHLQKYRLHVRKLPAAKTATGSSTDEEMGRDKLGLGYSNSDTHCSGSPEGPLHLAGSGKCKSSSIEDDDEENSDGHSWKAQQHIHM